MKPWKTESPMRRGLVATALALSIAVAAWPPGARAESGAEDADLCGGEEIGHRSPDERSETRENLTPPLISGVIRTKLDGACRVQQ